MAKGVEGGVLGAGACSFGKHEEPTTAIEVFGGFAYHGEGGGVRYEAGKA